MMKATSGPDRFSEWNAFDPPDAIRRMLDERQLEM